MVGSKRQGAVILAIFAGVLILSASFVRFEGSHYTKPLRSLLNTKSVPLQNHFPSEEQKLLLGASNVWEDAAHSAEPHFVNGHTKQDVSKDVFVLLKTGAETMWSRVPVHFNTTMKQFPHNAIYSDMGAVIDGHVVWDVLQYLPSWLLNSDSLQGYRVRRASVDDHWGWGPTKLKIEGDGAGWQTDRFKNIPAFIHAWEMTGGEMPWYFMIDGDTYVLTSTVAAIVQGHDPDEVSYFGHGIGANPLFAHGGSGIMLSRGAMRAMFHDPGDIAWHKEVLEGFSNRAIPDCCGDSLVATEFERLTRIPANSSLELIHHGLFQGNSISSLRLHEDMWCAAVGTFHHISAAELQTLYNWENLAIARKGAKGDVAPLLNADFYEDFVEPFLVEERPGWFFDQGHDESMAYVYTPASPGELWDGHTKLDTVGSQADCQRACVINETCLAWEWHNNTMCRILTGEFSLGKARNQYSADWKGIDVVAGHMVDRISAIHKRAPCRAASGTANATTAKEPGWYYAEQQHTLEGELVHKLESRPLFGELQKPANSSVAHLFETYI